MTTDSRAWHIVTCEYPPSVGGVSAHTRALATALAARGDRVHVWSGTEGSDPSSVSTGSDPEAASIVALHPVMGRFSPADCLRTGRLMNQEPGPRRLFVQWVPHGYGAKGMNLWMALWIASRALIRRDELHVMIHEPYMELTSRPAQTIVGLVQRLMLAIVCRRATHVWLSIPGWGERLRRYVPARIPMSWLPVPACGIAQPDAATVRNIRAHHATGGTRLVGHFSTYAPPIRPLLDRALAGIMERTSAHALLIGRGSQEFRADFIAARPALRHRVHAIGVLDDEALAAHIAACDLFVQPYPDGISARRTSALLPLSLGLPVVTNTGHLTEAFWTESHAVDLAEGPDAAAVADRAVALLTNATEQARLGASAWSLYDQRFDIRHAMAQLEQAA